MKLQGIILGTLAFLLAAVILIPTVYHYRLKAAVARYRTELKAKGEPMELAQVLPPSVNPERNGTELFLKAAPLVDNDKTFLRSNPVPAMKMVAPGKAMVCAGQPQVREPGEGGFTNSWDATLAAVDQNKEALTLLRQIINRPEMDFHIHYEQGFYDGNFLTNLHLVTLKQAVLHLKSAAMNDLHQGNSESAVENVQSALTLANAVQNERLEITELVRLAMAAIAQEATWELLQATNLTDAQLSALQSDWAQCNALQGSRDALNMENIVGDIEVARWRGSNRELNKLIGLFRNASSSLGVEAAEPTLFQRAKQSGQIFLWRYWWSYSDELRSLKGQTALMEAMRSAETTGSFLPAFERQQVRLHELGFDKLDDPFSAVFSGELNFHSMLSGSILVLGNAFKKVMRAECMQHMTITAIALKRFQLEHGHLPEKLSELTPKYLPITPLDPVDGQPLRYRLNADGTFTLYSVGENGKDDNGNPGLEPGAKSSSLQWQSPHALDWVWPQPATEAEIQAYYEKQAASSD